MVRRKLILLFLGQSEENEIRIVLVGRPGSGKSSTGNILLDKTAFLPKGSLSSFQETCNPSVFGKKLVVTDTQGLFDTKLPQGEKYQEIVRCMNMSTPGPHAFLLILPIDSCPQEAVGTFEILRDLFGEQVADYTIIVFTHYEESEYKTLNEFIASTKPELNDLSMKVKGRCIGINNGGLKDKRSCIAKHLFKIIEDTVATNNGKWYTIDIYQQAEEFLNYKIKNDKEEKTKEMEQEVNELKSRCNKAMVTMEQNACKIIDHMEIDRNEISNIEIQKMKTEADFVIAEKMRTEADFVIAEKISTAADFVNAESMEAINFKKHKVLFMMKENKRINSQREQQEMIERERELLVILSKLEEQSGKNKDILQQVQQDMQTMRQELDGITKKSKRSEYDMNNLFQNKTQQMDLTELRRVLTNPSKSTRLDHRQKMLCK